MARINLSNAVSFNIEDESHEGHTTIGSQPDYFRYCSDSEKYFRKARITVDFGTFERKLWFDTQHEMENFISTFLPADIDYLIMT